MLQSLTVVLAMLVQVFYNSSALIYLVQTFRRILCCALSYAVLLCSRPQMRPLLQLLPFR
jgi:hypothetical protein